MKVVVTADRSIRTRSVLTVLALAGAVAAIVGGSANAGSQAANGRIAYVSDAACRFDPTLKNDDIFSMNPDGSGKADLTNSANPDGAPSWSTDGMQLAFTRPGKANNDDIFVMNSNGRAQRNVTKTSPDDANPDWTPTAKITYDVSGNDGLPGQRRRDRHGAASSRRLRGVVVVDRQGRLLGDGRAVELGDLRRQRRRQPARTT
jgi:dipeptidyl aminopeptidase/acylaminoacyl peptidase